MPNDTEIEPDFLSLDKVVCTPFESINEDSVRELRLTLGISQAKFAKRYGMNLATLKTWEAGHVEPKAGPAYRKIISDWLNLQYVITPRNDKTAAHAS